MYENVVCSVMHVHSFDADKGYLLTYSHVL